MKKAFILLIAIFATFTLTAQIEWVGDFGLSSETRELYKTKNNQFIVIRIGQDDSGFSVLDSTGNLIFNYSDPYNLNPDSVDGQGHIHSVYDFIEMADSTYLFILFEKLCDYSNTNGRRFRFIKFDNDWNELVMNEPIIQYSGTNWGPQFLSPLPDNTFYRIFPFILLIEKRDCNGNVIWSKQLPDHLQGSVKDLLPMSGDTTVLVSWADSIYLMDNQGEFIHSFRSPTFDNIKKASNGNYYGQKADTIFVLDPSFSVIDHLSFPSFVQDFALTDSALVVMFGVNEVYVYDDSLNLQNMFQIEGEYPFGHHPWSHLEALSGSFIVANNTYYGADKYKGVSPLVKEYPMDGNVVYDAEDIGVTAIEAIGLPYETAPPFGDYQLVYDSLKITVQNFGDNTIDSLKLNADFVQFREIGSCIWYYQLYHEKYTGVSLMPGESIDLYWEDFSVFFEEIPTTEDFEICIWTSLPNQKIDRDSENDIFCTDFLVSDKEVIPTGLSWNVFPNPVYDYLNIELDKPLKGCEDCLLKVMDITGRERYRSSVNAYNQPFKVPVWDWEAGLYFLQYLSDGEIINTSRFVVVK